MTAIEIMLIMMCFNVLVAAAVTYINYRLMAKSEKDLKEFLTTCELVGLRCRHNINWNCKKQTKKAK